MTMRRTCLVRGPLLLPALLAAGSAWSAGPKSAPVVAMAAFDILGKLAGESDQARPGRVRPGRLSRRLIRGASTVVAVFSPAIGREMASVDFLDGDLMAMKNPGPKENRQTPRSEPVAARKVVELGPTSESDPNRDESSPTRMRLVRNWARGVKTIEASWSPHEVGRPALARRFRLCTSSR
ncbi:hypothetical protein EP7_004874 [Isosphaeraceae bacterium EP7]